MSIDESELSRIRLSNHIHTALLLLAMAGFVALLGYWLFGWAVALFAVVLVPGLLLFNPASTAELLFRAYRAQPIQPSQAGDLYSVLVQLSQRAGLPAVPQLYYLPTSAMTAFASGQRERSMIALSDGLLRGLTFQDLIGVLAHEISHIRHEDLRMLALADTLGHLARTLCTIGQLALIFLLPLVLMGVVEVSLLPLLLLIATPLASALLQLALSRNRELLADLSAAQLMGDSRPLKNALIKLNQQNAYWERYLGIERESALLRTHPNLEERLQQLESVEVRPKWEPLVLDGRFDPYWERVHRRR